MSQNNGDPVMYGLYAVLVHSGYSCHAGHYYCYVKVSPGCSPAPLWLRSWVPAGAQRVYMARGGPGQGLTPPCSPSGQQRAVVSDERLPGPLQQHQGGPQPAGLRALLPEVRCPAPPGPAPCPSAALLCCGARPAACAPCCGVHGLGQAWGERSGAGQGSCVDEEHVSASELLPPAAAVRL